MYLKSLLARLLAFLFPRVTADDPTGDDAPPEGNPAPDDEPPSDDDGPPDDDPQPSEGTLAPDGDPQPQSAGRKSNAIAELRRRTQAAEQVARDAQAQVQNLSRQTAGPSREQQVWAEEEARLANAEITPLERWQIDSSRRMRAVQQQAAMSLAQAQDMSDRAAYTQKSIANPVYQKYAERVERKIAELRQNGQQIPPREVVLAFEIGQDHISGKFTRAAAKAPPVQRGKPSGARSDVPTRTSQTERQKRYARLENIPI